MTDDSQKIGATSIMIVDDEPIHLDRMRILLDCEADFQVAGAYVSAEEALEGLGAGVSPDILLTDLDMPGAGGLSLIKNAKSRFPDLIIIVLTALDDVDTVVEALREGAVGYLLKTDTAANLCSGLREVMKGGSSLSPKIARALINRFAQSAGAEDQRLTDREKEILTDASKGLTYKETAGRLDVSVHTIHYHVAKIFEKLDVRSKMEALQTARKRGLI